MKIIVNYYGLKLFLISAIIFTYLLIFKLNLLNLLNLKYFFLFTIIISLISFLFLEDLDFSGYFLSFFWSMFTVYFINNTFKLNFSFVNLNIFYFNVSILLDILMIIFFSFIFSSIFFIFRFLFGRFFFKNKINSSIYSKNRKNFSYQNIYGSFFIVSLLLLDTYYLKNNNYIILNPYIFIFFFLFSYILSFFSIKINEYSAINLSLLPLIIFSVLPYLLIKIYNFYVFLILITLLFLISYIFFYFELKIEIDPISKMPTGNVIDSYPRILTIFIISFSWLLLSYLLKYIISIYSFLFIQFPLLLGSLINDYRKGKIAMIYKNEEDEIGIVGGVGLSDGLWINIYLILIVYMIYFIIFK